MKKTAFTSIALLSIGLSALAGPRSLSEAKQIAAAFLNNHIAAKAVSTSHLTLATSKIAHEARSLGGVTSPAYYALNIEDGNGFVIVSGDDRFREILGYSSAGQFDEAELPENVAYWLQFLSEEMQAKAAVLDAEGYNTPAKSAPYTDGGIMEDIAPLLSCHWHQGKPFNQQVPVPYTREVGIAGSDLNNGLASTGCVATGMAQVMYKWKYPEKGQGTHTNAENSNGKYTVDFSQQTYDWSIIRDNYGQWIGGDGNPLQYLNYSTASYSDEAGQKSADEVAKLLYNIGVAVDMKWGADAFGQSSSKMPYALRAMIDNFGYNKHAYIQDRDMISDGAFKALLINDLKAGRPIMYSGYSSGYSTIGTIVGHFFVIDGYDAATSTFHVNWGWKGMYNGYYAISAMEPGTGGIGAGQGSYNYSQGAYLGIQPEEMEIDHNIAILYESAKVPSSVKRGQAASVSVSNIVNNDPYFSGKYGLAIYDANGNVTASQLYSYQGFDAGSVLDATFSTPTFNKSIPEGEYTMKVVVEDTEGNIIPIKSFYGNSEAWKVSVQPNVGMTPGDVIFTPVSHAQASITFNVPPVLVPEANTDTIYQSHTAVFEINVTNNSSEDFYDEIGVVIQKGRSTADRQLLSTVAAIKAGETRTLTIGAPVTEKFLTSNGTTAAVYTMGFYGDNGNYAYSSLRGNAIIATKDLFPASITMTASDTEAPTAIEYYNLNGTRILAPSTGITIRRSIYRNGTVKSDKLFIK